MYPFEISPRTCRGPVELAALRGTLPTPELYEGNLIDEDAKVTVRGDGVLARLVRNALPEKLVKTSAERLRTVHGDLTNRGSVVYRGSMMGRNQADGSYGDTKVVLQSMIELLAEQNARVGLPPPQSSFLGYYDKPVRKRSIRETARQPSCRETAWTLARPDIFAISEPLAREVEYVNKTEDNASWKKQRDFMRSVSQDFKYLDSIYSTMTVNLDLQCALHTDAGDFRGGLGNLVVLELGREDSGILVMPRERVAFLVRPRDVLLMDVHHLHGNLPLTLGGTRLTLVLYARERINKCGK
jgi:hypothetical protein